jgi:predicted secreted Zn-dependent protease
MYYHLKNAVTHLPGAAVGEPLFREAASYYELLGKTLDHLRHKLNNTTFC